MNYFAHALNHLDQPYLMAGTAIPDWLSVVDRKIRLRPRLLEPWLDHTDPVQSAVAQGALKHLHDDDWFHSSRGFFEVTTELTRRFREFLGANDEYHCGFLGHVGMELILDGVLIEAYPDQFRAYWECLDFIEVLQIEAAVNRMAKTPTERLAWFIDIFRREKFLADYPEDRSLLRRLNQVLVRVKLRTIPDGAVEVIRSGRSLVRERIRDLLPVEHFSLP